MTDETVGYADLTNLAKDLSAASGEPFKASIRTLIADAAMQVQQMATAYAPRKTGRLAGSITSELSNNGLTAVIGTPVHYARFDEFGTGQRGEFPRGLIVIVPKKAPYLVFKGKDGRIVRTKKVVSRGMAPRPFLRPALERVALPLPNKIANQAVVTIVQGPNAPETLNNAPATGVGRVGSVSLVKAGAL